MNGLNFLSRRYGYWRSILSLLVIEILLIGNIVAYTNIVFALFL